MSAQPWVCSSCRSVNQPREGRCYRCRTPRNLVEADPNTLLVAGAGSKPTAENRPVGTYRGSGDLAFLAQVLIAAALAVAVVGKVMGADVVTRVLEGQATGADAPFDLLALIGGLGLALGAAALVAFALWLSRVVSNVPTIGLGWPNVTPMAAIFETIVPGVNLYRVPAVLRDVSTRLQPGGRGEELIVASWLALVGGVLLPRVVTYAVILLIGSVEEFVAIRVLAGQLALGLTVVGGIFLIALIQWIESAMDRTAAERTAATPATSTGAGSNNPPV